jgi:hypothetical protein
VASVPRSLLALLASLVTVGLFVLAPTPATAVTAPAGDVHADWGSTSAPDAKVRKGCHGYAYAYALTPPDGDWALETFLIGPHGKQSASGYFVTGDDPVAGPGEFRLCRRSTRGGQYTIRALLTVQNGGDYVEGWLPETTFRLRKPR